MNHPFSKRLENIPPSGIRKFFDLVAHSKDIISLGVGEPDFSTPWAIREEAISTLERGTTAYTSNSGLPECREAIATYLKNSFNCSYNPANEMILTFGVSEAVDIAFRTILNEGDEVILFEPCYVCYAPLVTLAGGHVVTIDTSKNHFLPPIDQLKKAISPLTKAVLICSPNNPTGAVIPSDILQEIAALSIKHGFWVITDEVYAELSYDKPFVSYASLEGIKEKTILLNGFSKAFAMTGWRLGYVCSSQDFISRALKIHQYSALCAPTVAQYAAIEALNHPESVVAMKQSYQARRNLFVKRLNQIGLPTLLPEGAFYCFPSIMGTGLSSEEFAVQLLKKTNVAVVPGSVFGQGGEGFIRCCYATDLTLLKEAVLRIHSFLKKIG